MAENKTQSVGKDEAGGADRVPSWGWKPRHWAELIVVAVLLVLYLAEKLK